jgi:hypothetical protein
MTHGQKNITFFLPLLKLVVKKLLELSCILKKKNCIPRSFLVINVCNKGKALCPPCTSVRPEQRKRDVRFGTLNVMRLYRAGSLTGTARELAGYKLDLVRVQGVRWDREGPCKSRGL